MIGHEKIVLATEEHRKTQKGKSKTKPPPGAGHRFCFFCAFLCSSVANKIVVVVLFVAFLDCGCLPLLPGMCIPDQKRSFDKTIDYVIFELARDNIFIRLSRAKEWQLDVFLVSLRIVAYAENGNRTDQSEAAVAVKSDNHDCNRVRQTTSHVAGLSARSEGVPL